jgi:Tol biopolymer transport system component
MDEAAVRRALISAVVPGELEARRRGWTVVREVYEDQEPLPLPISRRWPVAVAAAAVVLVAAAVTPPGRAVLGSVRDAIGREKVVGVKGGQPSLFSLPAQGKVLAVSTRGPWVVSPDGSKRLLGAYRDASWSPFGRFVVATKANELDALEPGGRLHWSIAKPGISGARWGGTKTDTRIAYLSGGTLHVIGGDGTGDRILVPQAAAVAPAWKPGGEHVLAYVTPAGAVRIVDTDSGDVTGGWHDGRPQQLAFSADGKLVAARSASALEVYTAQALRSAQVHATGRYVDASWSPTDPTLGFVTYDPATNRSIVWTADRGGKGRPQELFGGAGHISSVTWSPDGRWLLAAWDSADQWVFIRTGDGATKVVARSSITEQLNGHGAATFPAVAGWSSP